MYGIQSRSHHQYYLLGILWNVRERGGSNLDTITTRNLSDIPHINRTGQPKYLWTLKVSETNYHLKQSIKSYPSSYKYGTRRCNLYLNGEIQQIQQIQRHC